MHIVLPTRPVLLTDGGKYQKKKMVVVVVTATYYFCCIEKNVNCSRWVTLRCSNRHCLRRHRRRIVPWLVRIPYEQCLWRRPSIVDILLLTTTTISTRLKWSTQGAITYFFVLLIHQLHTISASAVFLLLIVIIAAMTSYVNQYVQRCAITDKSRDYLSMTTTTDKSTKLRRFANKMIVCNY